MAKSSSILGLVAMGLALAGVSIVAWVTLSDQRATEPVLATAPSQAHQGLETVPPEAIDTGEDLIRSEVNDPTPAQSEAETAVSGDAEALEAALESVTATFLTDEPDLLGLREVLEDLSRSAEVVAESVEREEDTGVVKGKIRFGETGIAATFTIDGDRYNLSFSASVEGPDQPFFMRTLWLGFSQELGHPTEGMTGVQFHPDARANPSKFLRPGEEEYVGWSIGVGSQHSTARPLTMRAGPEGRGWIIGKPQTESFSSLDAGWAWHPVEFEPWRVLLRPFAP